MKINYTLFLLMTSLLLNFSSCSKDSEKKTITEQPTSETTEFTETNEDLLTVDYDYFYKELSSKGEWIEVSAKDLGIDIKSGKTTGMNNNGEKLLSDILGIKKAYAQSGEEIFNLFVWRPANELANTTFENSQEKEYTPYNNGQWLNTDAGWYFKAETPQEDLTCHYGRWTQDQNLGWVWLPGKTWSPAWVEWRENPEHVAWTPVPPGNYIENDAVNIKTSVNDNKYTIVEKKSFTEPSVYKYRYQYVENKNKIMIKEMTKTDGVMIKNKTVINKGPVVADIEKSTGKKIEQVRIKKVSKKEDITNEQNTISAVTPEFKKVKDIKKEPVSKPEKLVSYKDAKKITKEEKEELKEQEKQEKKEEKEMKKDEKELKKEEKKEEKDIKKEEKKEEKEMKKQEKEDKHQDKDKNKDKDNKGNKNDDKENKKTGKDKENKEKNN